MSEIKKGDLVMVVGPTICCQSKKSIGQIHLVKGGVNWHTSECETCGLETPAHHYGREVFLDAGCTIEVSRLKKIDPPATGEYARVPVRKTEPETA